MPCARFQCIDQGDSARLQRSGGLVPRWHWLRRRDGQVSLQRSQPALIHDEGRQGLGKKGQPHIAQNPPNQRAAAGPRWAGNCDRNRWGIPFCESFHQGPKCLLLFFTADQEPRQRIASRVWHGQVQFDGSDTVRKNATDFPQQFACARRSVFGRKGHQPAQQGVPLRRQTRTKRGWCWRRTLHETSNGFHSHTERRHFCPRRIQGCSQAEKVSRRAVLADQSLRRDETQGA